MVQDTDDEQLRNNPEHGADDEAGAYRNRRRHMMIISKRVAHEGTGGTNCAGREVQHPGSPIDEHDTQGDERYQSCR